METGRSGVKVPGAAGGPWDRGVEGARMDSFPHVQNSLGLALS